MWRNPITAKQIRVLTDDWGVKDEGTADGASVGWFKVLTVSGFALLSREFNINY